MVKHPWGQALPANCPSNLHKVVAGDAASLGSGEEGRAVLCVSAAPGALWGGRFSSVLLLIACFSLWDVIMNTEHPHAKGVCSLPHAAPPNGGWVCGVLVGSRR